MMPPEEAMAPPQTPDPPPKGIRGTACSAASLTSAQISSVDSGQTMKSGGWTDGLLSRTERSALGQMSRE